VHPYDAADVLGYGSRVPNESGADDGGVGVVVEQPGLNRRPETT